MEAGRRTGRLLGRRGWAHRREVRWGIVPCGVDSTVVAVGLGANSDLADVVMRELDLCMHSSLTN